MEPPTSLAHLPEGIEFVTDDVSAGDWVDRRLLPFRGSGEGVLVGEILPTGFDAYARAFHPAFRQLDDREEPVRWAELAAEHGTVVHPEIPFEGLVRSSDPGEPVGAPSVGCLPRDECGALAGVLAPFTSTPERCWFCVWEGFGFLSAGAAELTSSEDLSRRAKRRAERRARAEARARTEAEARASERIPKVRIHPDPQGRGALRAYLLFRGPVDAASRFVFDRHYQSPNLWWPDDRAWCVATEIDGSSTYIGGSRACVDALLACSDLEALPSAVTHRFVG